MKLSEINDPKAFEAAFYGKHGITPAEAAQRLGACAPPKRKHRGQCATKTGYAQQS